MIITLHIFRNYYYFAIVEDLVVRFSWVYVLILDQFDTGIPREFIITFTAALEVMRR